MLLSPLRHLHLLLELARFKLRGRPASRETLGSFNSPVVFPLQDTEHHYGFGSATRNQGGLQAEFFVGTQDHVTCRWSRTTRTFQGFPGNIHGGILAVLADEVMAHCLVAHRKKFGVIISARIRWHRPVRVGDTVSGEARIVASLGSSLLVTYSLANGQGKAVSSGWGLFYLPTVTEFQRLTGGDVPAELKSYARS